MALRKAKVRRSSPRRREMITVNITAMGFDKPFQATVEKGSTVDDLTRGHLPPSWAIDNVDIVVNNSPKPPSYLLNDGDGVTFVPKVTGG
jgi:molybdopterin converting factor small subunit